MMGIALREPLPADLDAVRAVHDRAFGTPGEGELVALLHGDGLAVASVLAADEATGEVVGHALCSALPVVTGETEIACAALAPVAVVPERQGQGIGGAVVRRCLALCRERRIRAVLVLGDPAYYVRFGFSVELGARIRSPYAGAHFMALELEPGALAAGGEARYPAAFSTVD